MDIQPLNGENISDDRKKYYGKLRGHSCAPLWEHLAQLVTQEPVITAIPHIWDYSEIREDLLHSAKVISAEEAERRVLMLENPALEGKARITESMYAGLQLIMPGEVARAHRHSPAALRFIVEGSGGYTSVNGEKTYMEPGDFIITPSMAWHDHGNDGEGPVIWMDGLDLPLVNHIGAMFMDHYPDEQFPEGKPHGDSLVRYGNNMRPVGEEPDRLASPIFSYPYSKSRETLEHLSKTTEWDPYHGLKLEYIDPTSGGPAMSTISTFLQLLPKGFKTEKYQTTENTTYSVIGGKGRIIVSMDDGEKTIEWEDRDIFVIPCWYPHKFESDTETTIFSFSDKAVQTKLGLYRQRRGNK
jgi:gentisate 1,2-dioxygenase